MKPAMREKEDLSVSYGEDAFSREDETDDRAFYARDRFVDHLDSTALATVERIIGELIIEGNPEILDLMAGWDSHIPPAIRPARVVGLGLNPNELSRNETLAEYRLHDVNRDPRLPFGDETFDAVLNTVSVDYMTRPLEVFQEVGRVLKPGGLFLVTFSNRFFPQKAVRVWRTSTEEERILFVEELFARSDAFDPSSLFISKGRPRPKEDKYAHLGIPSDPVYAVYAEKRGGRGRRRPSLEPQASAAPPVEPASGETSPADFHAPDCPHCGSRMRKWAVPQTPFTEWNTEFMYICFNDNCSYLVRGWQVMNQQGNRGMSYRCMYNPESRRCLPVPVPGLQALKDGIVD